MIAPASALPATAPRVPALCPGGVVACIAGGPSVTPAQLAAVRGQVDAVIAINGSYRAAPWADALYACDDRWRRLERGAPSFTGHKFALEPGAARWPGVVVLRNTGHEGLETDPSGVRTGRNSGYQAINVAVHLGARRVILLGYDMTIGPDGRRHHYDATGPTRLPFQMWLHHFETIVAPLAARGVDVVNCSPRTALRVFPCRPLAEVLPC